MEQGLTAQHAIELMSDPVVGTAQTEREPVEGLVDASDRDEGGDVISWMNDIEQDPQYARWPSAISGYMRPLYPGQLHLIRRNTWNVILVLDLGSSRGIEVVASQASAMIMRNVPIHIGIVPSFKDKNSDCELVCGAFN
jgi:UDP-glucose:glycoprotein glucosyltransferase